MTNGICKIPVNACIEIINGEAVMVAAEWEYIEATAIAAYLVEKMGPGSWEREAQRIES